MENAGRHFRLLPGEWHENDIRKGAFALRRRKAACMNNRRPEPGGRNRRDGGRYVRDPRAAAAAKRKRRRQYRRKVALLVTAAVLLLLLIGILIWAISQLGRSEHSPFESGTVPGGNEATLPGTDVRTDGKPATETEPETVPETATPPEPEVPAVQFSQDLSAYEEYMNPAGANRDAFLTLVNVKHPLGASDIPSDLIEVKATRKDGRNPQQLRLYAAKALEALFLEAESAGMVNMSTGYALSVTSAYRSYSYQEYLFNSYVESEMANDSSLTREQAEAKVMIYSCRAGTSEHQSGLCCDMHNQAAASSSRAYVFAETPEGIWLTENCWKFGFVLRFPADKQEQTGITYESWHFRYVGRYHAYRMTQLGMCLEEYTEYLAQGK